MSTANFVKEITKTSSKTATKRSTTAQSQSVVASLRNALSDVKANLNPYTLKHS